MARSSHFLQCLVCAQIHTEARIWKEEMYSAEIQQIITTRLSCKNLNRIRITHLKSIRFSVVGQINGILSLRDRAVALRQSNHQRSRVTRNQTVP